MATRFRRAALAPCIALAALAACGQGTTLPAPAHAVTGHVTYRERMALPPDAEVRVMIVEASRADSAKPVADTTFRAEGRQVPLPFTLPFDRGHIDPRRDYALRATITSERRTIFSTPLVVLVITHDHPTQLDLVLAQVPGTAGTVPASSPAAATEQANAKAIPLVGTSWVLEDIGGTAAIDAPHATLEFPEADRAVGNGSCNRFSGGLTLGDSTLAFSRMLSTKIACPPPVMSQEAKYLQALQGAERYALEGTSLLIYVKGMDKPLRFSRVSR
ncbi:MAG: YbaY family lipoprotein [Gemmatimonadales bacterium]